MKFNDRKDFLYDPTLFSRADTQTALKINAEYIRKFAPNPRPKFFEINKTSVEIDKLWHVPTGQRTPISREIEVPCLNMFERPDWRLMKVGLVPVRKDKFLCSNLILQELDYFPSRGDLVAWNGYRYAIINVVLDPTAYWHQTNVWMGLYVECSIAPEGDASPVTNVMATVPAERAPLPVPGVLVDPNLT